MSYLYLTRQIVEVVNAPKVLRRPELLVAGKPLPFSHYGENGRRIDLDLDLADGTGLLALRFHVRAPSLDAPTGFEASLILANKRVRGIGWHATGKKRYYKQAIPKGWHQNVIDPNQPPGHPDENRHLPINDFAPADLVAFFTAAAKTWNINLPAEEYLL
jgi:hypothetical protein